MMARILRTELRRSAALGTVLAVAVLGAAMLYAVANAWTGRWGPLALWQREYMFVLWPLALGAGAWQARRESRSKVGELFTTTPRPRWQRVTPTAAAMAIAGAVGYLGMYALGAVRVASTATYFPLGSIPVIAVGMLAMVVAVWLGLAIGSFVPSAFTPPAVVVGGLIGMIGLLSQGDGLSATGLLLSPVLFREDEFMTVASSVNLGQVVWFAALAASAFILFAAVRWGTRAAAALPAVAGVAVATAILPNDTAAITVPDRSAQALVCTSDAPKICVTKVHASWLDDMRGPAREALTIMSKKLPNAPTAATESITSWVTEKSKQQPTDTLLVEIDVDGRGSTGLSLWELLDGAGSRRCTNTPNNPSAARLAAAAWLMDKAPPADQDFEGKAHKLWTALRALPAAEQQARVAALRKAALACEDRDITAILTGGSR